MGKTYTVKQVAEILGYSTNSIYTFLDEGRIKGVRVGKGRFRISEEELNRVLHLSKKTEITTALQNQAAVVEKTVLVPQNSPELQTVTPVLLFRGLHIASIFDWFIGAAGIILGASLVLYSSLKGRLEFSEFLPWLSVFEISFIAGGLGIILTDLMDKKVPLIFHWIFHVILIVTYGAFSFVNLKMNDPSGFLLYGLIALIIFIKFFIRISGVRAFIIFLILFGFGLGLEFIFGMYAPIKGNPAQILLSNKVLFASLWLSGVLIIGLFLFLGEKKPSVMFWLCMIGVGLMFILSSVFFANSLNWSKSFFYLVTGLTCFLTPVWILLRVAHEKRRRTLVFAFGMMVGILIIAVSVIRILQFNMAEYAARDLKSRLDFGQILVKERADSLEKSLEDASRNQLLLEAVKREDPEELLNLLKLVYSNNENVERFTVFRRDGAILSMYPYHATGWDEVSDELFSTARDEKKIFRYDSQNWSSSSEDKLRVGMSAPLIDLEGEAVGVLMAEIDLVKLKNDLGELANPVNEEYFLLYDRGGKVIINSEKAINFSTVSLTNNGLKESFNNQGQRVYEISEKIANLNWKVQINSLVDKVISPTKTVSTLIFLIAIVFIGAIGFWLILEKRSFA